MVTLITGPLRAGKTSRLLGIAAEHPNAGGFCCPKQWENDRHTGYDIQDIATGETTPFAIRITDKPATWREADTIGNWSFCETGFRFAEAVIREAWERNRHPIFMDEVGPLELQDRGFSSLLRKLLVGPTPLYIVVRDTLADDVVRYFELKDPIRIQVNPKEPV